MYSFTLLYYNILRVEESSVFNLVLPNSASNEVVLFYAQDLSPKVDLGELVLLASERQTRLQRRFLLGAQNYATVAQVFNIENQLVRFNAHFYYTLFICLLNQLVKKVAVFFRFGVIYIKF